MSKAFLIVIQFIVIAFFVSCKKENVAISVNKKAIPVEEPKPTPCPDSLVDIDGNVYRVIDVNGKCWTAQNLKVSRYVNGDSILNIVPNQNWVDSDEGATCVYMNDTANNSPFGKLYNGMAVVDARKLCPAGWHVASDTDWTAMTDFLGGAEIAGGKLKATNTWAFGNVGSTDEIGFSALPGGRRYAVVGGVFTALYNSGYWWTSTLNSTQDALWARDLNYPNVNINRSLTGEKAGYSVRCVRN